MSKRKFNLEANETIRKGWDTSADWYESVAEQYTTQGLVTCAVMSSLFHTDRPQRVLEVACGPGKHSLLISQSFLRPDGAVLVSCDYSSAMVDKLAANYEIADYSRVAGNKFVVERDIDYCEMSSDTTLKHKCDLDEVIKTHMGKEKPFRKFVYGCRANNELLPFPDETFSAYLANLSVMLVDNPMNQFKESYRVLQRGCWATFVIWGKQEETLLMTHVRSVLQKHMPKELCGKILAERSHFDLFYGKHFDVEKTLHDIGFSQVKMWLQPMNFLFRNGEEFMKVFGNSQLKSICARAGFDEQKMKELYTECVSEFDKVSGADTSDLRTFQVQVIVCYKDATPAETRRPTKDAFPHVMINGHFQPPFLQQRALDDLQANWQLRDSDIVISTYPKCGTTWMQQIVLLLQFNGDGDKVKAPMEQAPWIEAVVSGKHGDADQAKKRSGFFGKPCSVQELTDWDGSTEEVPAPPLGRVFKTHCFAQDVPWKGGVAGHGKAKIIVVVRNPKDACISHYHHHKNSPLPMGAGVANIGVFAQRFFEGEVYHGDFWEWHAGWEKAAANDSGIYWVSYEAIKKDPCCEIRNIAEFLSLEASDELVEKVADKSSFSSMKEQFAENDDKLKGKGLAVKKDHLRNGQAGSWRKDIFGDLNSQFNEVHASKCAALGLKYQFDFEDA